MLGGGCIMGRAASWKSMALLRIAKIGFVTSTLLQRIYGTPNTSTSRQATQEGLCVVIIRRI